MPVSAEIQGVFGHFQNLNLLALLNDLREGRVARQAWRSVGSLLCPVAHGLPSGSQVENLCALGQVTEFDQDCHFAALLLGAEPDAVARFVHLWDGPGLGDDWLLRQLDEMWEERLTDAEAMQDLLQSEPAAPDMRMLPPDDSPSFDHRSEDVSTGRSAAARAIAPR